MHEQNAGHKKVVAAQTSRLYVHNLSNHGSKRKQTDPGNKLEDVLVFVTVINISQSMGKWKKMERGARHMKNHPDHVTFYIFS